MPNEQVGQPETLGAREKRRAKSRIVVVLVLLIAAFSAGFIPQYLKASRLANVLRDARQENSLAQLRDLAGLAYLQASQKDYGLAGSTMTSFFDRTQAVANQTADSSSKKPLEDILSLRDGITTQLAKGDPGVLNELRTLLVKTRQATATPSGRPRPE